MPEDPADQSFGPETSERAHPALSPPAGSSPAVSPAEPPSAVAPPLWPPSPLPLLMPGGGISLLAGAPGTGKTALLATIAVALRDQQPIFDHTPELIPPQGIIVVDRSWVQSTSKWFTLAGYADIPHYSLQDDYGFAVGRLRNKSGRMTILRHCLEQLGIGYGGLVYVDPIAPFFGGVLNDYDTCLVACTEIRRLALEFGITLLGLAHASKQWAREADRYLRPQDRIAGSTAQLGYTDTTMYLAAPAEVDDDAYQLTIAPHHVPAETHRLRRDAQGLFYPVPSIETLHEQLLEQIPVEPGMIATLALLAFAQQTLELPRRTVFRLLKEWSEQGLVQKAQHGHYQRPSAQQSQSPSSS